MSQVQCPNATFSMAGLSTALPRRSSTMERRSQKGFLGSIKHTLSRRTNTNSSTQKLPHPQSTNIAQPTRRPGKYLVFLASIGQCLIRCIAAPYHPLHNTSSSEAPPAYSPAPNAAPQTPETGGPSAQVADDPYSFLNTFDTIFLIDDSGSMAGGLWRQTADALMTITPICTAHDEDGIDIWFLNHGHIHRNVTSASSVQAIFETVRPGGPTPTGQKLNRIFREYLKAYTQAPETTKPINIICITDGEPTDDVEGSLIYAAKKLDKLDAPAWQIGVQFFQVGSDPKATAHLRQLDDELAEIAKDDNLRDMVDTVPFTSADGASLSADGILKVVLGAVTRRLDRKSKELHR